MLEAIHKEGDTVIMAMAGRLVTEKGIAEQATASELRGRRDRKQSSLVRFSPHAPRGPVEGHLIFFCI